MKKLSISAVALALIAGSGLADPPSSIRGFTDRASAEEATREAALRKTIDPARIRENMRTLSARPHHVGSEGDRANAEWILAQFKSFGWDAKIETFEALFPTPADRLLEMTGPTKFTARLDEPVLPDDPTTSQKDEQLPTYNAYSPDGDVTGELVYVNYGVPADYEELERLGVSVKGKIAIAKYGGSWRGIKPKVAAEHGAIGCLIYSDPSGDGYLQGDVFPKGAYRPPQGVQRGSVADMPLYPGDPETPGVGSVAGAKRLTLAEAKTIAKIPTLPISYGDAEPFLRALTGPMAPESWRGALPFPYHLGPGGTTVHLRLKFHWDVKPVRDIIAKLPGSEHPEQWVIRGNHHDAWVNGAEDPISGQSAMLEEARALGELVRAGWKPKRTIVYCAWDGEEPGLLGSTEWAETHADELGRSAVVYINSDTNGRGFWQAAASHTLERFFEGVAESVTDPETRQTVARRARLQEIHAAATAPPGSVADPEETPEKIRARRDLRVDALGSGSDYTAFLDHLGIASANLGFGGEDDGGIYHSIYDDFYWFTHFSDTDFAYGKALAEATGTAVMRLAEADILPFDFGGVANAVSRYVGELKALNTDLRSAAAGRSREVAEGAFLAANDPRRPSTAPKPEQAPPVIGFAPLENAASRFSDAAERYDRAFDRAISAGDRSGSAVASANARLVLAERAFLSDSGLPGRPWFRHQLYAPGFYTGYGVKTLPAVREAIEQKKWELAETQVTAVARVVDRAAALVSDIAADLERAVPGP